MVLNKIYEFSEALYPSVARSPNDLRAPRSFSIDPSFVQPLLGADGITQRILPPGTALGSIPGSAKVRPLPRTRVATAAITGSTTTFAVSKNTARFFKAAEVLVAIQPLARVDFALTWADGDTATLVLDGRSVTYTVSAYSNLTTLAAAAAAFFAASFGPRYQFLSETQYLYVFEVDGKGRSTISASEVTAGTGTFAVNGGLTQLAPAGTAIGTILSVDAAAETITLTAAASNRLPIGAAIGVQSSLPTDANGEGLGFLSPTMPVDIEWGANTDYGAFVSGSFYRDRMPYLDGELTALFPELVFG
ncbi:MAG TPA: hypothetical protein V6C88_17350 [Chroococcidiopsis sp.]